MTGDCGYVVVGATERFDNFYLYLAVGFAENVRWMVAHYLPAHSMLSLNLLRSYLDTDYLSTCLGLYPTSIQGVDTERV